jgi:VanZ family protein
MQKTPDIPACNSRYCVIWPLLYMVGIFGLSSISDQGAANDTLNPLAWISPNVQNFLHLPVYGGLAFLWFWALRHWVAGSGYKYLLALLLTLGYGFLDEWHQTFVPGRFGTLTDVGFDVMGAVIGLLIYRLWFSVEKKEGG